MTKTLTARYESIDAARNAVDDLLSSGIPREKYFLDEEASAVKVITPDPTEREIREILGRHQPTEVTERAME